MTDTYIISKMNEFMFRLTGKMGNWLADKLPRLTDRWWDELVLCGCECDCDEKRYHVEEPVRVKKLQQHKLSC